MFDAKSILFFVFSLFLHFVLLVVFSLKFYIVYFLLLFSFSFFLFKLYTYYSKYIFFISLTLVFLLINLNIYENIFFDISLYLNIMDKLIYINSEVMYALTIFHILVLLNLKKFVNIWDIIDKKLLGWY